MSLGKSLKIDELRNLLENTSYKKLERFIDKFPFPRESDRIRYKKMLLYKKDFARALTYNLTKAFLKDFQDGIAKGQSFTYQVIAKKGRGKTLLAYLLATMVRRFYPLSEIPFVYTLQMALEWLEEVENDPSKKYEEHSTFTIDEPLRVTGQGKNTVRAHFDNVEQMCREFMLNLIFNVKQHTPMGNVDIYLEPFGIDWKNKKLRCLWRDDDGKYLGYIILDIVIEDKEEYQRMRGNKKAKWKDLISHRGQQEANEMDSQKSEKYIQEVLEKINASGLEFTTSSEIRSFIRTQEINVPIVYLQDVSKMVKARLRKDRKAWQSVKGSEVAEGAPSVKRISLGKFLQFAEDNRDEIYSLIPKYIKKQEIDPFDWEVYECILSGMTYSVIMNHYKSKLTNKSKITEIKNRVQQTAIGYAGELAYFESEKKKFPNLIHRGMNTNLEDFVCNVRKWVISFKTVYLSKDIPSYCRKISQNEINYAYLHSYQLIFAVYVLSEKKLYLYKYMPLAKKLEEEEKKNVEGEENNSKA